MTTKRLQREGAQIESDDTDDRLMLALYEKGRQCSEELGNSGCDGCPVVIKCNRLWRAIVNAVSHNLSLTEYRRLSQKFYMLRQERNRILEGRRLKP